MRLVRAVLSASVAVAVACGVVACADDGSKLPSVGGGSQSVAGGDLVAVAQGFHDCLKAEGLPVEYEDGPDGRSTLVTFDDDAHVIWVSQDAWPEWTGEPMLEVDGVDRTDVWVECVAETGYSTRAVWDSAASLGIDPVYVQAVVEANNEWAACARANGYPDVADSTVPRDSASTEQWPTVLLPRTITEEQLRALLEVCPNFDPEQMKRNDALTEERYASDPNATGLPEGYELMPDIGFDFPGYDGDYRDVSDLSTMDAGQAAIVECLGQLQAILWEASDDYHSDQYGDYSSAPPVAVPSG
jgi:hypothetical protein